MYALMGRVHAQFLDVEIPKPDVPNVDSNDIKNKADQAGDWLSVRSPTFWMIIVVLFLAYLGGKALKKPAVKGFALGFIALAIVLAVLNN